MRSVFHFLSPHQFIKSMSCDKLLYTQVLALASARNNNNYAGMHFQISLLQYPYHVTIVSSFCHQFLPRSSVAMSAAASSFQTLLATWEAIIEFRPNLNQCRQSVQLLSQAVPNVLPAAREWIVMANQLLDRIEPELQRTEHQLLCVLQLQLQHALDQIGHLPQLDAD